MTRSEKKGESQREGLKVVSIPPLSGYVDKIT
jgi:hypothetical protein